MALSGLDRADNRRLIQELRTQNVLTIATILNPDLFKGDVQEDILRKECERAILFINWMHKSIQESIQ